MNPYVFIGLSVSCSLIIAHLLKTTQEKKIELIRVLTINYLVASVVSFSTNQGSVPLSLELFPVLSISILLGALFITNFFLYSICIQKIGMGLSIASMRLSLIIPIVVSVFIFNEHLSARRYLAIGVVFLAFILMLPRTNRSETKSTRLYLLPILLFFFNGIVDAILKVFERIYSNQIPEEFFLGIIFLTAFLIGSIIIVSKKKLSFTKTELFYGILIGVANLYSSFFLLLALNELPGAIVFSLTNILTVFLGTTIGIVFWKDSLTIHQKIGISAAMLAIILLVI